MDVEQVDIQCSDVEITLNNIIQRIKSASTGRPTWQEKEVTLVAVSKTKPTSMIMEAYQHGQRHFGENYVNEFVEKATDKDIIDNCPEIKWHFIGHLQTNKVGKLVSVPNLHLVETIDSEKLAAVLDKSWSKLPTSIPLNVFVQVNTSGEENKSGVHHSKVVELVKFVQSCSNLKFCGLMTIGSFTHDCNTMGPNPDFKLLKSCKDKICDALKLNIENVELSMGMTNDFEHAIEMGSTSVRVGSGIFGERDYSKIAKK